MSTSSLAISPTFVRIFTRSERAHSGPAADVNILLERIRQRQYSESVSVLASWWLKTVYCAGHNRVWWSELDAAMKDALRKQSLDATASEAIRDIRTWVRQSVLSRHNAPPAQQLLKPPFRPDLTPGQVAPYLARVLNEWLPTEVARLLTDDPGLADSDDGGMPALVVAKALERLLLREHFSPASLELLVEAAWPSPECFYPAHVEIFRDVASALLGRTAAPPAPVVPATALAGRFADAAGRAFLVTSEDGEECHVPLDPAEARGVLEENPVRIESLIVTSDGRWWHSVRLQKSGPETVIVYVPGGRLRIDFSSEHARLVVPWLQGGAQWAGSVHLPERLALFGREWRGRRWEWSADRPWLHLEFASVLPVPEGADSEQPRAHRLRPVSAEIAWTEVERALAAGGSESLDQLRREELIPLAHALDRLTECLLRRWPSSRGDIERSLRSVHFLQGDIGGEYGRIPWRVLSTPARAALLKRSRGAEWADLMSRIFDGAPAETRRAA